MPVLGGNHPETCFSRYGGTAFKAGYVHEMALRLVLHAASTSAAKYGREVRPLLCLSVDFYVRIFVRVCSWALVQIVVVRFLLAHIELGEELWAVARAIMRLAERHAS